MQPYISIVMPAYNEENVIEDNIQQVRDYLNNYLEKNKEFEIIVVDDGSTDTTGLIIDELAQRNKDFFALHHTRNIGRGKGLRTGFAASKGKFIVTLDADLSYSPDHIEKLLSPLEQGKADIVLASIFHAEGNISNVPFKRKIASRLGNMLLSRSLKGEIKTLTCLVRAYTREVIDTLELFNEGKDIHLEIIQKARMLGFRIIEVPAGLKWKPYKRTSDTKGLTLNSFKQIATRHLFFNFLFRPSMISWLPVSVVGIIFIAVTITLIFAYQNILAHQPPDIGWQRFYFALRQHMLQARVSYFVWSISLLLLFQFISLIFISKQNSHHYEELFMFLSNINKRLKDLKEKN